MKPALIASSIAAVLLAASFAAVAFFAHDDDRTPTPVVANHGNHEDAAGADESRHFQGIAGDHHGADVGMERPQFPPSSGSVPTAEQARSMTEVRSLRIIGDEGFNPSNGIVGGSGTIDDPYVITGFHVLGDLYLQDTDACFEIKENYIAGQLSLNWNAQCVFVHHNFINDLRVNENIKRLGFATGGLIELNKIDYIGQLRHYDGEFRHNIVGPRGPDSMWDEVLETVPWMFGTDPRVANVDGFNQGLIHHNTFIGSVDLDLHGHHHGTGFFAPHSHYHGADMERYHMDHDHGDRWTSVSFTDNKIIDPEGYGLRYEDRNHAGDDRRANSESLDELNMDHQHHTYVEIARNVVEAGQIWIDVFNADDRNHYTENPGWLDVVDNTVVFNERDQDGMLGLGLFYAEPYLSQSGIVVYAAKEVQMRIVGNNIVYKALESDDGVEVPLVSGWRYQEDPAAIRIDSIRSANILVEDNTAKDFHYGVWAHNMDGSTEWKVTGNDFSGTAYEVFYDDSVANKPAE